MVPVLAYAALKGFLWGFGAATFLITFVCAFIVTAPYNCKKCGRIANFKGV